MGREPQFKEWHHSIFTEDKDFDSLTQKENVRIKRPKNKRWTVTSHVQHPKNCEKDNLEINLGPQFPLGKMMKNLMLNFRLLKYE